MVLNNSSYSNLSQLIGSTSNFSSLRNPADLFKILNPSDDYKENSIFKSNPFFEPEFVGVAYTPFLGRTVPSRYLANVDNSMFDNPALCFVSI